MFPGGAGQDPCNKWIKRLSKFWKKNGGLNIKSHDFRVTTATEYYEHTKDLLLLQEFLGHSSPTIT